MNTIIWAVVLLALAFLLYPVLKILFGSAPRNRRVDGRRRNRRLKNKASMVDDKGRQEDAATSAQKLRVYLQLMDTLINTIPNPIFYQSEDGVLMGCNRTFADTVLGLTRDRIIGRRLSDLATELAPDLAGALCDAAGRPQSDRYRERTHDATVPCADGVHRDFLFSVSPVIEEGAEPDGTVCVMFDLTEKNRAAEDRMEQEKFRGVMEIAGAVCHEFNQPLQALSAYAELAEHEAAESGGSPDLARKISVQVERMAALTGKLQRITHYETMPYSRKRNIFDIHGASSADSETKKRALHNGRKYQKH